MAALVNSVMVELQCENHSDLLASVKEMKSVAKSQRKERKLVQNLQKLVADYPYIGDGTGEGTLESKSANNLELKTNRTTMTGPAF